MLKVSLGFVSLAMVFGNGGAMAADSAKPEKLISLYSKKAGEAYAKLPPAKKGGILYTRLIANPKTLNPIINHDWEPDAPIHMIYTRLMEKDADTSEYFPLLAEKMEVTKDRKVAVYTLRKEAVWSDGTPVTTDDVEFTYHTLWDPKVDAAPKRAYFGAFKFEKVDGRTFKFSFEHPGINTLVNLNYDFFVIQKKQFAGVSDFNTSKGTIEPIGNGPYKFKSFSRDQKLEFERDKNWWGYQLPTMKNLYNFDSIVYRIISDTTLAYEKFIKGEIDILDTNAEMFGTRIKGVDKAKFGTTADSGKPYWGIHARTQTVAQLTYIGWNLHRPMFESKKTRQALAQLVDYDQIINKVYFGEAIRSVSPFGSLTPNTAPGQLKKAYQLNPAKALALLKEDGWADVDHSGVLSKTLDGKPTKFEFTLMYNSENPMRAKISQMVKENFKKAGIVVNIRAVEFNTLNDEKNKHNFDALVFGWAGGNLNSDVTQIWASKSYENEGSNFIGYKNDEVDRLAAAADAELDVQKHFKIVQKVGAILYDDQPYVFLLELPGFLMGVSSKLKASKWYFKYEDAMPLWQYSAE
jgi:ABC-type transport system substrate-binding protein